jgi:hypothetical protein
LIQIPRLSAAATLPNAAQSKEDGISEQCMFIIYSATSHHSKADVPCSKRKDVDWELQCSNVRMNAAVKGSWHHPAVETTAQELIGLKYRAFEIQLQQPPPAFSWMRIHSISKSAGSCHPTGKIGKTR